MLRSRDTAPPEIARKQFKAQVQKWEDDRARLRQTTGRKTPVDAFPGDLLFFLRVTYLMHGLGALCSEIGRTLESGVERMSQVGNSFF